MFHLRDVQTEWIQEDCGLFNELIVTWNGKRPSSGQYLFYVKLKLESWSPYLLYGLWGHREQASFASSIEGCPVRVYQDVVEVSNQQKASGFAVLIVCENGASLKDLYSLHVYTNQQHAIDRSDLEERFLRLPMPGLSQMVLSHPRAKDLCSPTSTTAVIHYLGKSSLNPVSFADLVWDQSFDIFGNWVLNLAQASSEMGPSWECWVQRLSGFSDIYERLARGDPVVVSVRGPLIGSAQPYAKGHLLVVIGYNPAPKNVLCMDPAFPLDSQTLVSYPLQDFMEAWKRRGMIAYIWQKTGESVEIIPTTNP
jgi:hypothetical protein